MSNQPLIAVIDDEDSFLELMEAVFEEEGYRVVVGKVPDDALTLIRQTHPDLVVLDLNFRMSAMQGMAILRAMRDDTALVDIPVIVCSGATDKLEQHQDEFNALSAHPLDKPFNLTDLLTLVADLLPVSRQPVPATDGLCVGFVGEVALPCSW